MQGDYKDTLNFQDALTFENPFTAFFADKSLSVPLSQVILFALIITLCMLFGRHKMGLLVSYAFVFYWGFVFNRPYFIDMLGNNTMGLYAYTISGFCMAVLSIAGMFQKD
ncbi:hypothetical protein JYT60_01405 [bacterium AH-315-C08]|nr:hypothetical protein [bacterium AH-315-C08]